MMSVREGYKQTEVGVIPEEWEVVTFETISELQRGTSFTKKDLVEGSIPVIAGGKEPAYYHNEYNRDGETITISGSGANAGFVNFFTKKIFMSDGFTIKGKDKTSLTKYLFYFLKHKQDYIFNLQSGGAQPHIYIKNIAPIVIPLPPLPEQQKIAAILTSVDNKIEVIDVQIAKTERLKKGLMQKLLSEGIGHTEFKESEIGRIPKEWEVVWLGDCIDGKGRYGINAPAVDYDKSLPAYLRITDIDENGNFIASNKKCVSHKDSADYKLSEGDIVFARTGNTTGKTYLYNPKDGELIYAGFLIKFTPLKDKLDSYYLKLITTTARYWNWVKITSTRTGQPGINSEEYAKLLLPLPPLSEQKQIAKILSITDNKLDTLRAKKEKCETLKKGLMQKLLTGEVRVKVSRSEP